MCGEAMLIAADSIHLKWTLLDGLERHFFCSLSGLLLSRVELTENSHVGILVEAGIRLHAGFGLGAAFDHVVIVMPKAETPFKRFAGVGMFEVVRHSLSEFEDVTVSFTGFRIMFRETVGIELEETIMLRATADDDVFAVMAGFLLGVHGAPKGFYAYNRLKIAHSTGPRSGISRKMDVVRNNAIQTGNNLRF